MGGYRDGDPVAGMDMDAWDRQFALNARSAALALRAVLPGMVARGGGRAVAVGTRAALRPFAGASAYAASKAAVLALVSAASEEVKRDGVCVNAVLPSVIDTPANRAANPDADPSAWVQPGRDRGRDRLPLLPRRLAPSPGPRSPCTAGRSPARRADGEEDRVHDYPQMIVPVDHIEPVPRRIRAFLGGQVVLDTVRALYVWEWATYPQYYVPVADVAPERAGRRGHGRAAPARTAQRARAAGGRHRAPRAGARVRRGRPARAARDRTVRLGRPRRLVRGGRAGLTSTRAAPTRAWTRCARTRRVRIELEGTVLAESSSPVMVFETGLPTALLHQPHRRWSSRTSCPSATETACPYKGVTSVATGRCGVGETLHADLAWSYDFPTSR